MPPPNMPEHALEHLSPSKRAILYLLNPHNKLTVQEVSDRLQIQLSTARKRLETLEREGLIEWQEGEPEGRVGRISRRYFLTARAHDMFPRAYGRIACNVL